MTTLFANKSNGIRVVREGPNGGRRVRYRAEHWPTQTWCYGSAMDEEEAASLAHAREVELLREVGWYGP